MSWELVDGVRRFKTETPPQPSAEDLAVIESQRLEARHRVKERGVKQLLAERRRLDAVEAIEAVNDKKEQIAAVHVAECAPLQRRLKEIEDIQIANIKARKDGDPAIEEERKDLLFTLRDKNAGLQLSIDHQDSVLKQLEADRLEAAKQCGSIDADLIRLGRPDLLATMRVKQSGIAWAKARLDKAENDYRRLPSLFFKTEMQAASEQISQAQREADAALAAVLEE